MGPGLPQSRTQERLFCNQRRLPMRYRTRNQFSDHSYLFTEGQCLAAVNTQGELSIGSACCLRYAFLFQYEPPPIHISPSGSFDMYGFEYNDSKLHICT